VTYVVTEDLTKPTISVNNSSICLGDNETLTATGANIYAWSPASGLSATIGASVTANPTVTTTYTVTGTNTANGCTNTATATVTVKPIPAITNALLEFPVCSGDTRTAVNLTANVAGTTFTWAASKTGNIVANFTTSGTTAQLPAETFTTSGIGTDTVIYLITPTADGCVGTTLAYKVPVRVCTDLSLAQAISNAICYGEETTLTVTVSNNAGVTATNVKVNIALPSGLSYVSDDSGGHYANGVWTIPAMAATSITSISIVVKGSVAGVNQPVQSYISSANNTAVSIGYTETLVTVNPLPAPSILSTEMSAAQNRTTELTCATTSILLTATGGNTYIWRNDGSTADNITITSAGTYWALAMSAAGCIDSTSIAITQAPITGINIIANKEAICPGDEVILNYELSALPEGGYSIVWDKNGTVIQGNIRVADKPAESAMYRITLNSNGCIRSDSVLITVWEEPRLVEITPEKAKSYSFWVTGDNPPFWYSVDNSEFKSDYLFENLRTGKHHLYVRDNSGCRTDIAFEIPETELVFPKFFSPNEDGLNDFWLIENIEQYPEIELLIFDRFSKELLKLTNSVGWQGWDGKYLGKPMVSDDYWYILTVKETGKQYVGHFTLLR
jgi:gliding motility-associated-like protein/uncharacterized repeat protein (TIGR01451 family)